MKTGSKSHDLLHVNSARALGFVAVCGLLVVLEGLGDDGREWLRFDRQGLENGQIWRLVTGHAVHLGWPHLWLNLAGLALLWILFVRYFGLYGWCLIVAFSMASIDAGLYWLEPRLNWYVGLSGVLHGILAAGAFVYWHRRERGAWMLASFLIGKLLWEQWLGPLPARESFIGGSVAVDAHLYGALGGTVAAFGLSLRSRRSKA